MAAGSSVTLEAAGVRLRRWIGGAVVKIGGANLAAALLVFLYTNELAPASAEAGADRFTLVSFGVFMAISFPAAGMWGAAILVRATAWLRELRSAREEEIDRVLTLPLRLAAMAFSFWLVAIVYFAVVNTVRGDPLRDQLRDGLGTLLGGLTAALLSFLLLEFHVRPVLALALAGRPPTRTRTLRVRTRILLAWGLGSGIPLAGVAAAQLQPAGAPAPRPGALLFLAVVGLVVGFVLLGVSARSVAEPLEGLRSALARVREGDLGVVVPVEDGGEVGMLQGGVNEMVAGLRERRRLEDLFGRHVGTEVARRALAEGGRLGGEVREASALFVDLVDSSRMAGERAPQEVVALLNDFFEAVVAAVDSEGGWVNKFEGDGALCVFGAPGDQADHAARALRAARTLAVAIAGLGHRHPGLDAGIGVSSGEVVAGNVGAAARYEYTVIGDPVNEAARLTEAAKGYEGRVLASEAAVQAAGAEAAGWVPVAELPLRGRPRPTKAYSPS